MIARILLPPRFFSRDCQKGGCCVSQGWEWVFGGWRGVRDTLAQWGGTTTAAPSSAGWNMEQGGGGGGDAEGHSIATGGREGRGSELERRERETANAAT